MLGYMSESSAKAEGFTHHGKYYGIPIWVGEPYRECLVATKVSWMDPLMVLFHHIEGLCHSIKGTEPSFMLHIGRKI